jgi:hypothetical protein
MWFAYADSPNNMMAIPIDKVKKVIRMNQKNKYPPELEAFALQVEQKTAEDMGNGDDFVSYI